MTWVWWVLIDVALVAVGFWLGGLLSTARLAVRKRRRGKQDSPQSLTSLPLSTTKFLQNKEAVVAYVAANLPQASGTLSITITRAASSGGSYAFSATVAS